MGRAEQVRQKRRALLETWAKRFPLSVIVDGMHNDIGFCLLCGAPSESHVEPDAIMYPCVACSHAAVYGASEILILGLVDPDPETEESSS